MACLVEADFSCGLLGTAKEGWPVMGESNEEHNRRVIKALREFFGEHRRLVLEGIAHFETAEVRQAKNAESWSEVDRLLHTAIRTD
jgi:hypothetical protein